MGYSGPKASNIYQNPGVKNNSDIKNPSLSGVGSPAKLIIRTIAIYFLNSPQCLFLVLVHTKVRV